MKNVILHLPDSLTAQQLSLSPSPTPTALNNNKLISANPAGPQSKETTTTKKITVVFFITGNPGLISYYEDFLDLVAKHWRTGGTTRTDDREGGEEEDGGGEGAERIVVVAGASLAGFFTAGSPAISLPASSATTSTTSSQRRGGGVEEVERRLLLPEGFETKKGVYDLQDQVRLNYLRLVGLVKSLRREVHEIHGDINPVFEVVLAGHSVGAYIALELVRLHHEEVSGWEAKRETATRSIDEMFDIVATFLLTPTIHNISHSSSGRIATPVLGHIPFFPTLVQLGASGLASTFPESWLQSLVGRVTGMKNQTAVETTTDFLRMPGAVRQALHMAGCEMREIGEDKWTEEVWGAVDAAITVNETKVHSRWTTPRHFFLFAKEDHWVANATREAIASKMRDRAVIIVDSEGKWGLQHAWCLQQNDLVAGIVNSWINELFNRVR